MATRIKKIIDEIHIPELDVTLTFHENDFHIRWKIGRLLERHYQLGLLKYLIWEHVDFLNRIKE